jgi:hypothetical protein
MPCSSLSWYLFAPVKPNRTNKGESNSHQAVADEVANADGLEEMSVKKLETEAGS